MPERVYISLLMPWDAPTVCWEKRSQLMIQGYRCKGCGYFHVGPAP